MSEQPCDLSASIAVRVRHSIVKCLDLDIAPDDIDLDMPLFGESESFGLGLDSLAALEVFVTLTEEFGLTARDIDPNDFASARTLTEWILRDAGHQGVGDGLPGRAAKQLLP